MDWQLWKKAVLENSNQLELGFKDRASLKSIIKEYLSQFFDYDSIEFEEDWSILMKWGYGNDALIDLSKISELGMDFSISTVFEDDLGQCIVIKISPFSKEE